MYRVTLKHCIVYYKYKPALYPLTLNCLERMALGDTTYTLHVHTYIQLQTDNETSIILLSNHQMTEYVTIVYIRNMMSELK